MGQFKPMPKMMTTEPTVILKLKKGGHVASEHKDDCGHTNMKGKSFMSARADESAEEGSAPMKPSMSDRRKAMSGALMSKKGGKVAKKAMGGPMGGPMGAAPAGAPVDPRKAAMMRAMLAKRGAMGAPAAPAMAAPAGGLPTMKKGGKAGDKAEDKAMIKKAFKQHDAQEHEGSKGTKLKLKDGGVSLGKPGGYKTGGGVSMSNGGGYAKGGGVDGNVSTSKPGVTNTTTGGVKKANGGGYAKGGAAKKHFATGGSVNDAGKAVAMPKKPVSKPVSNTAQSGTFKKGGKVQKFAEGDSVDVSKEDRVVDASKGAYDKALEPEDMDIAKSIRNAPGAAYAAAKRLLGIGSAKR